MGVPSRVRCGWYCAPAVMGSDSASSAFVVSDLDSAFVEVAVTVRVPGAGRYHYRVPAHLRDAAQVGARVLVQFGRQRVTGVVVRATPTVPAGVVPVPISEVLDAEPALSSELVELCVWIADYYEAPLGEVVRGALPAGTGVTDRKTYALTETGRAAMQSALPAKHRAALAHLESGPVPAAGLSKAVRTNLESLVIAGFVQRGDARQAARARLRRERVVALATAAPDPRATSGAGQPAANDDLSAAGTSPARRAVLAALQHGERPYAELKPIRGAARAVRELAEAGWVTVVEREVALDPATTGDSEAMAALTSPAPVLTAEQAIAVDAVTAAMRSSAPFAPFLLHGVTGSGKTEVYLRVIAEALAAGNTALVLVPEISLTPQLAARFRARFGDLVAILHSGLTEQARLSEWSRLRRGQARIAVGARSAVFAPLCDLGVIVVDEEHDGSFKQEDGVRYHARDIALVRAQRSGAVCVLGSATPSLESYAHAERSHYKRLVLTERPTARPMPQVDVVDLRTFTPDGEAMLSAPLRAAIAATLAAGDQIILFLNRRGFATFVLCGACGHSFRCAHCAVSLTYHRHCDRLTCHYCGYSQRVPERCPECSAQAIVRKGLGTEKVAAAVAEEFTTARVARLDRDVASGAKVERVLAAMAQREIDILVGTQMVTKGHDFPGVTLVGVVCADTGLDLPDFRASERTFQLLAQVAGRAGRGDRAGRVIVQTYRPQAAPVVAAAAHDYQQFFQSESQTRAELGYPPHGRLVAVRVDGSDEVAVADCARRLAKTAESAAVELELAAAVEIRGPVPAPIEKLRGRTRWQVWLRSGERHALRRVVREISKVETPRSVRVVVDVDPISAL